MEEPLLEIEGLTKRFGGLVALSDVHLRLRSRTIAALIGPNGAGKTTLFNILAGLYRPDHGEIRFGGRSLVGLKPHEIVAAGVARTFQNIRLFGHMTALENVLIGMHAHLDEGFWDIVARRRAFSRAESESEARAIELIRRVGLDGQERRAARELSYGEQRRLELARALAAKPRLLLLDEPTAGMSSAESHSLMRLLQELVQDSVETLFIIEHNMRMVLGIAETVAVLDYGQKIAEGSPDEIVNHPRVIEAYLGRREWKPYA
ncbi:MAG TPA: ABC transporter ATP-binding protein [Candidatus Acidoferrales bacterium]|nr:ABC transporter ATP-binding protein [Candidatus Acidoferrales bacterium]